VQGSSASHRRDAYCPHVSRIPLVDPDDPDADPKARALLLRLRKSTGRDINVLRALANHPDVLEKFLNLGNDPAPVPHISPAQRELAYLAASVANDCHY
jgi:alkylhydroperoxidase family enzyme